jgi:single-strand DNA-binding protein
MPSLNKVLLMGNLTRDPELRVTPKGTPICQFSLAINRQFKMESGESREEVIYVDVEAWGKQGETIAKYCTKGRPLYVEGRLRLDQWEDKNTKEKRSRMKVVLEQFQFLGDGRGGGGSTAAPSEPGIDQTASPERYLAPSPRLGRQTRRQREFGRRRSVLILP